MNLLSPPAPVYAPPYPRVIDLPLMLIISGPSGVGKDSVVQALMQDKTAFHFVVTATSRPPRPGELHGVDYIFVSEEEFERMIDEDELLEYAVVHDNYKGVPKSQIRQALASGKDVLMRVDPQGAATITQLVPQAISVFLTAESEEALSNRLHDRHTETSASFDLRLQIARDELERIDEFDYCVVNRAGKLEETVRKIRSIITAEHCRTNREPIVI
jgi:guanylate kinase